MLDLENKKLYFIVAALVFVASCLVRTVQHISSEPAVVKQYVAVIDAGSMGSRINIYHFQISQQMEPVLISNVFDFVVPGLSSYADDAEAAAGSLVPLLDLAMSSVPEQYRSSTPLLVKATAGLRLLNPEKSKAILSAVSKMITEQYPFRKATENAIDILDGKDEGVYAWISVNYILGNIGYPKQGTESKKFFKSTKSTKSTEGSKNRVPTAAIFDLGGGSTQIVFQPDFTRYLESSTEQILIPGDHKYSLQFGDEEYTLYQHSHLGYGLIEARKRLHQMAAERSRPRNVDTGELDIEPAEQIYNPCIVPGQSLTVEINVAAESELHQPKYIPVTMYGEAAPTATDECLDMAYKLLNVDEYCSVDPCGFNGVHQPSLSETFCEEDMYIFSYFYDRIYPLFGRNNITVASIRDMTNAVCQGPAMWTNDTAAFTGIFADTAIQELKNRPEYCLDLSFIYSILHFGYGIPSNRELKLVKSANGLFFSWALGAALSLLDNVHVNE